MTWQHLTDVQSWWPWISRREAKRQIEIVRQEMRETWRIQLKAEYKKQEEHERVQFKPLFDQLIQVAIERSKGNPLDPVTFRVTAPAKFFHHLDTQEREWLARYVGLYVEDHINRLLVLRGGHL